jgi:hypothetical protein
MRRQRGKTFGHLVPVHELSNPANAQPVPPLIQKQGETVRTVGPLVQELWSRAFEIGDKRTSGGVSDRKLALLAALAGHPKPSSTQIDVADVDRAEFSHAQTRPIQKLQDRPVADPNRGLLRWCFA